MDPGDEGTIHLPVYGFAAGHCHATICTPMIPTLCGLMYVSVCKGMHMYTHVQSDLHVRLLHTHHHTHRTINTLNAMMFCLPVAARAILMALSTASLPLLQKKKRERCDGHISVKRSMSPSCGGGGACLHV